jgi:hypothetical protein
LCVLDQHRAHKRDPKSKDNCTGGLDNPRKTGRALGRQAAQEPTTVIGTVSINESDARLGGPGRLDVVFFHGLGHCTLLAIRGLKTGVNLTPFASGESDEGCFATQANSTGKKARSV